MPSTTYSKLIVFGLLFSLAYAVNASIQPINIMVNSTSGFTDLRVLVVNSTNNGVYDETFLSATTRTSATVYLLPNDTKYDEIFNYSIQVKRGTDWYWLDANNNTMDYLGRGRIFWNITLLNASGSSKLYTDADGNVLGGTDANTEYTAKADMGLLFSVNEIGLVESCGGGEMLKWDGAMWECSEDLQGGGGDPYDDAPIWSSLGDTNDTLNLINGSVYKWDKVYGWMPYMLNTTTEFDGDVSGTFDAIAVDDNSHNHDFTTVVDTTNDFEVGGGFLGGGVTLDTNGNGWFAGSVILLKNITAATIVEANFSTNLMPWKDATFTVGNSSYRWSEGHFLMVNVSNGLILANTPSCTYLGTNSTGYLICTPTPEYTTYWLNDSSGMVYSNNSYRVVNITTNLTSDNFELAGSTHMYFNGYTLASTTVQSGAEIIGVKDTSDFYTQTNVENILAEIGRKMGFTWVTTWLDPVLTKRFTTPPTEDPYYPYELGDRHIVAASEAGDWCDACGDYRIQINPEAAFITGSHTNFTSIVYITDGNSPVFSENYNNRTGMCLKATAYDKTTELSVEVATFNTTAGYQQLEAYVRHPTYDNTDANNIIYLYMNSTCDQSLYAPADAWDSCMLGVYHMNDYPQNTLWINDSTRNKRQGLKKADKKPNQIIGERGFAQSFIYAGTSEVNKNYINITGFNTTAGNILGMNHTISIYGKRYALGSPYILSQAVTTTDRIRVGYYNHGTYHGAVGVQGFNILVDPVNYHNLVIAYNNSNNVRNSSVYNDGIYFNSTKTVTAQYVTNRPIILHSTYNVGTTYAGDMDELRISAGNRMECMRSPSWIRDEYTDWKYQPMLTQYGALENRPPDGGDWDGYRNWIAEWDGADWTWPEGEPLDGDTAYVDELKRTYTFDGVDWVASEFSTQYHEDLGNLYGCDSGGRCYHLSSQSQLDAATRIASPSQTGLADAGWSTLIGNAYQVGTPLTSNLFVSKSRPILGLHSSDSEADSAYSILNSVDTLEFQRGEYISTVWQLNRTLFTVNNSDEILLHNNTIVEGNLRFTGEIMPEDEPCSTNEILKSLGDGTWACAADATGASVLYTAQSNGGLALDGTAFRVRKCTDGQIIKNESGGWVCADDNGIVDTIIGTEPIQVHSAETSTVAFNATYLNSVLANYTGVYSLFTNWTGGYTIFTNWSGAYSIFANQTGSDAKYNHSARTSGGLNEDTLGGLALKECSNGQLLKNQSGGWDCAADATAGGAAVTNEWQNVAVTNIFSNSSFPLVNVTTNLTVRGDIMGGYTDIVNYQGVGVGINSRIKAGTLLKNTAVVVVPVEATTQFECPRSFYATLQCVGVACTCSGSMSVFGLDADGDNITQTWAYSLAALATGLYESTNAYSRVTRVTLSETGNTCTSVGYNMGSGNLIGLPNYPLENTYDVYKVRNATAELTTVVGTINPTYGTVDMTGLLKATADFTFYVRGYRTANT